MKTSRMVQVVRKAPLKQQLGSSPSATFWLGAAGDLTSLARRLGEFGIKTKSIRSGDDVEKGYRRENFEEAWLR